MAYGTNAQFDVLREVDFSAIGAAYAALGAAMTENVRQISFFNSTDQDIYLTDDITKDKKRIASGTGQVDDLTANKSDRDGMLINKGRQFYIKHTGAAPTTGNFWIQSIYASGGV
jgi:hypothetical protein